MSAFEDFHRCQEPLINGRVLLRQLEVVVQFLCHVLRRPLLHDISRYHEYYDLFIKSLISRARVYANDFGESQKKRYLETCFCGEAKQ